ncbi:ATP-dependent protease La [Batrachochytrium salamandrivorans]|nr:ATP-dependent protease La [Batrachochytrium salamandrivorans]
MFAFAARRSVVALQRPSLVHTPTQFSAVCFFSSSPSDDPPPPPKKRVSKKKTDATASPASSSDKPKRVSSSSAAKKSQEVKNIELATRLLLEQHKQQARDSASLAATTAALALPIPQASPVMLFGEKPLLPDHKAVIGGDVAVNLHLPQLASLLLSLKQQAPICIFSMPNTVTADRPKVPTLGKLIALNISCVDKSQFAVRDNKVYLIDSNGYVVQHQQEFTGKLQDVVKWDAELAATSFVQVNDQLGDGEEETGELVRYQTLAVEEVTPEFNQAWAELLQIVARFFPSQLVQEKTNWRETCAHLLYAFQQVAGEDIQRVLDCADGATGIKLCLELLHKEMRMLEIQQKQTEKMQMEQYRADRQELVRRISREVNQPNSGSGGGSEKTSKFMQRIAQFSNPTTTSEEEKKERLLKEEEYWKQQVELGGTGLCMPVNVKQVFDEEIIKLETLGGSELQTATNYLEWLTALPWGRTTAPSYDVERTMEILNRDHYGLEPVKKRIAEFVAVAKLNQGTAPSKILCLEGPPGVGKTSIGKSVAEALNKKFYRFSVGGLYDSSEIKGHRRTYVASRPGKLVECLKQTGTMNPLMMIDEVDKIGSRGGGMNGDPTGALLELLDPSQNTSFRDQFLDVEIDASKVLFLCTANDLSQMPKPLKDRMEIIQVAGYDNVEKVEIAKRYVEKRLRVESGVTMEMFLGLSDDILNYLVKEYSREPGVRKLTQIMDKIYRAVALEVAKHTSSSTQQLPIPAISTKEELEKFIGKSQHAKERLFGDALPSGVCTGLGANGMEGVMLYIECTSVRGKSLSEGKGSISVTGNLQQTMKESLDVAYVNAKHLNQDNDYFLETQLKMHVPYGGVPKDGPSAGLAMTMCLLSRAWDLPLDAFLAMTGEITLTGRIVAIGGVREKTLAARRSGIKTLIFPEDNRGDWSELADHLKQGIDVHFVSHVTQALPICFPSKFTQ